MASKNTIDDNSYLSDKSKELLNAIYPNIEKNFPSKSNSYQTDIKRYIDKNNEVLFASGPTYRLYFNDDERNKIFSHIGMRKLQIDEIIKKDKTVDKTWYELDPAYGGAFNLVAVLLIRFYTLDKKKYAKQLENAILYLALSTYSGRHFKSFPYPPNENIMSYTINNLSNKYKIKQNGTLIEAIKSTAMVSHETYEEYIIRGTDVLINTYLLALRTRIAGFLNKLAEEYYKNKEMGNYINLEKDDYSEENYNIVDNDSFVINRLSENVSNKIITKGIDYKLVKLSANMCQVSVSGLQKALTNIVEKKDREIKKLVGLILQLYLEDPSNSSESIGSKKFIEYCLQLYIKSNTNDKSILEMKQILDEWLTECSVDYVKTERVATKNNLRKACYLYIVFSIQQEAIKM